MNRRSIGHLFLTVSLALQANLILLILLAIWRRVTSTTLLFDQFVFLTLLCIPLGLVILKLPPYRQQLPFGKLEKFLLSVVISLLFFSTVQYSILAVDRSRSLYIFSWIEGGKVVSNGSKILALDFESKIEDLSAPIALQQRIDEQVSRKLMKISDQGLVENTSMGKLILWSANNLASAFELRGWYKNTA